MKNEGQRKLLIICLAKIIITNNININIWVCVYIYIYIYKPSFKKWVSIDGDEKQQKNKWVGMIRYVNGHDLHVLLDTLLHDYSPIKAYFMRINYYFPWMSTSETSLRSKVLTCDPSFQPYRVYMNGGLIMDTTCNLIRNQIHFFWVSSKTTKLTIKV